MLGVEHRDVELLHRQVLEPGREVAVDVHRARCSPRCARFSGEPAAALQCCVWHYRLGRSDAVYIDRMDASADASRLNDPFRANTCCARSQRQQRDRAERGSAKSRQALPRSFSCWHFANLQREFGFRQRAPVCHRCSHLRTTAIRQTQCERCVIIRARPEHGDAIRNPFLPGYDTSCCRSETA